MCASDGVTKIPEQKEERGTMPDKTDGLSAVRTTATTTGGGLIIALGWLAGHSQLDNERLGGFFYRGG